MAGKSEHPFDVIVRDAQDKLRQHGTEKTSQTDVLIALIGWQTERLQACFTRNQRTPFRNLVTGGGIGAGLVLGAYESIRRLLGVN